MSYVLSRLRELWNNRRQLMVFLIAVAMIGFAGPIFETTFNNFLSETFSIGNEERGVLEGPRELPGFLVTVSAGALSSLPETRVAAIAAFVAGVGMAGLGIFGTRYRAMMAFMVTQSTGTHLGMPIHSSIGLSLAREKQEGRRLGQIRSVGVAAAIVGCLAVWLLLRKLGLSYRATFLTGAVAYAAAAVTLMVMQPTIGTRRRPRLTVNRRYWLYYVLCILFGARKQIALTFGPWVLIKVWGQPASVFAMLWLVGSIIGVFFQPALGLLIDRLGERRILVADAFLLLLVCGGYGYADLLGLGGSTIYLLYGCYILDHALFAVGMARTTFLKKIAVSSDHVASTLALGISLDHTVSMSIPRYGGRLWDAHGKHGYRYVFAGGVVLATLMMVFSSLVRTPQDGEVERPKVDDALAPPDEPGLPKGIGGGEG